MNIHLQRPTTTTAILITAAAAVATALPAGAEPVEVPNAGFEEREGFDPFPEGTDKYNQWGLESWRHFEVDNNGGPLRIWNPGDPANPADLTTQGIADVGFGGEAPEGDYVVVVRSRYNDDEFHSPPQVRDFEAAVQLLEATFDPLMSYTLTVKVGRLPGSENYTPSYFGYAVQLAVGGTEVDGARFAGRVEGGTVIAEDVDGLEVPEDTFVTATVRYTPNPAHADLAGMPLQIRLCALEDPADHSLTGWVAFDDVALEAGPFKPFAVGSVDLLPGGMIALAWDSNPGEFYDIEQSLTLAPGSWTTIQSAVRAAPEPAEETGGAVAAPDAPQAFFRVVKVPPPPAFAEGFEAGAAGWTARANGVDAPNTRWELGAPTNVGPAAPFAGANGFGTDLDATYEDGILNLDTGEGITLTSPVIDLTDYADATLTFWYFLEAAEGEGGRINLLDEAGDPIGGPDGRGFALFAGGGGNTGEWTEARLALPASAAGRPIRLQWEFVSGSDGNPDNNGAGWYIDDIEIR